MANKLYAEYKDKPKIISWSNIPKNFADQIKSAAERVKNSYDIDSATTYDLDTIGRIVVRNRGFIESITLDVYEMNVDGEFEMGDELVQMSDTYVPSDSTLSNEYYRYLLRAKIAKNNSSVEIDQILTIVNTAIPNLNATRLIDSEDMSFSIEFYGSIDGIARDLLLSGNIVPTPQGVKFSGFLEGINMPEMNNDGEFEMGDESAEMVGFIGV